MADDSENKTGMKLPRISRRGPYAVQLFAGELYGWCTCGLSQTEPFCDGAHKGTGMKSRKFTVDETKIYYLCGCKHASEESKPFCDNSHECLKE